MMSTGRLSYHLTKKGQLNFGGSSATSKKIAEELLLKDAKEHHCFFRGMSFHNHLSHHILAAYDFGASAGLLEKIYAKEVEIQKPIFPKGQGKNIVVKKGNWVQYLGSKLAYAAFVKFFSEEIEEKRITSVLEKYIFEQEANLRGIDMLGRILTGLLHPLIGIGYGVEFGIDTLVATGLAGACAHSLDPDIVTQVDSSPPTHSISLLELLGHVYASPVLKPVPYNPETFANKRIKQSLSDGRKEEIERLCALYYIPENISQTDLDHKIEEIVFVATLLLSGTGRKGRKPRLDFFFMHVVNSTIFLKPICGALRNPEHKAALLRAFVPTLLVVILSRGRPRIDAELAMSYTAFPRPPRTPGNGTQPSTEATGDPRVDEDYNPWPGLVEGCLYHSDSHLTKAIRTLYFAAQEYGDKPSVPGAESTAVGELHAGIGKVDGTVFVRAAGVIMDTLGYLGHGQKEGDWDRSALGWDAAWESGD